MINGASSPVRLVCDLLRSAVCLKLLRVCNILVRVVGEFGGQLLIRDVRIVVTEPQGLAGEDLVLLAERNAVVVVATAQVLEIVLVCVAIEPGCASVAAGVGVARANRNIADRVVGVGGRTGLEPVLRAGVEVAQHDGRQTGNRVVVVGCAVLCPGLFGDKRGEGKVPYTRGPNGIKITSIPVGTLR